jgi:hypothetical protein
MGINGIGGVNGIDEAAPVISRHSAVIVASIENLWRLHTDVNRYGTTTALAMTS